MANKNWNDVQRAQFALDESFRLERGGLGREVNDTRLADAEPREELEAALERRDQLDVVVRRHAGGDTDEATPAPRRDRQRYVGEAGAPPFLGRLDPVGVTRGSHGP